MARKNTVEQVLLPQVNPGNVELALQALRVLRPGEPMRQEELKNRWGISQPAQACSMLRFLALLDESDCLAAAIAGHRSDAAAFLEQLHERVVGAYAGAGCGTRGSLGWLGRDPLTRDEDPRVDCGHRRVCGS